MTPSAVSTEADLFSPEVVADPYPVLAGLRDLGAAVYVSKYDFWLLSRYAEVREASLDWESFSSRFGVGLRKEFNQFLEGTLLASDPPEHDRLRSILYHKLTPPAMRSVRGDVETWARELASAVVAQGRFDACTDVAFVFPVTVMANLVGLPLEGRERFHPGADVQFAGFGPISDYLSGRYNDLLKYQQWLNSMGDDPSILTPGGWGAAVMEGVAEGRISKFDGINTLNGYLTAGMDTTVNAIGALFRLFAERPDVWTAIREDEQQIRPAIDEILRLESPVTGFFRVTTRELEIDGTVIPEGARVMLHWASANRDPRKYDDADRFVLTRRPLDHLAFGYGQHACAGRGLAMLEIAAIVEAFIPLVQRFTLDGDVVVGQNPIVHGLDSLPLAVTAA